MNERIGVKILVGEGEDAKFALHEAKHLADEFHKEANPELYKHNQVALNTDEISVKESIESATTMEQLGRIKGKLTPNTKGYYMDKMKTLTTNFTNVK
jgi:hypothetical protein